MGLGLLQSADKYLPKPGSVREYHPSEYIFPIILMLNGGGRSLEETRQIRMNEGLREILPLKSIPSSDAFGDWLRNRGVTGGPCGLERVNRKLLKRGVQYDWLTCYTVNIDATSIVAEKQTPKVTYKGSKGYMPIIAHLAENGLVLGEKFRQGTSPLLPGICRLSSTLSVRCPVLQDWNPCLYPVSPLCFENPRYIIASTPGADRAVETLPNSR